MIKQHPIDVDVDTQNSSVVEQAIKITPNQESLIRDQKIEKNRNSRGSV